MAARNGNARKRNMLIAAFISVGMLVMGAVNAAPALALTGDVHMADPSVIVDGSCWYGYSTGFQGGPGNGAVTIRKTCSSDHANGWAYVGTVWNSVPAWITTALGSTPPEYLGARHQPGRQHLLPLLRRFPLGAEYESRDGPYDGHKSGRPLD